ncbi:Mechanosensitive ion channel [Geoalkalibacter ferrihydriticus]|uniref:Mechanosensitive ion channel n=1 Tax=Geoalkalibacter ferrihydriticus TaxID=392333 RepID=A0A1G9UHE0_9BACT|nr:mechanosensitive ion channel domain-containing protein [Geoalkalibacter ferrihydriticus]SDM59316.1 Mechanosensitive ion channel [Geoalkalibacter ferrihydriticus]
MQIDQAWFERAKEVLGIRLFALGDTYVTLGTIIYLVVFLFLLFYLSGKLRRWMVENALTRTRMSIGVRQATGSIIRYFVLVIGFVVILQTAGIDLTTLNVLAGAAGIGLGFGLQNIVSNFISGLIILFERPIKVGDRIVVGNIEGDVIHIGGRSTTVVTNDNISIIVPNSKFIVENVVNWSHNEFLVRFRIQVSVAYGSNARLVEKLLLEVAANNPDILASPEPTVCLREFGDSGLLFELRVWSSSQVHRRGRLVSSVNFAIYDKFAEHGVEIPFSQHDLHIKGGGLDVRMADLRKNDKSDNSEG